MVTVKEAARLVGVSYATILKMIHRGLLPAEKGPRAYRISYADVVRQFGVKKNIPV
jgi:excisionase family DNA binding protein